MLSNLWRSFIRTSAFLRKEIVEVLRQPRLLFTLVLGPFLILLVFGLGYQNEPRALRTVFVAPDESAIRTRIEEYATTLGPQLISEGVTADEEEALARLRRGEVDVVAITPGDAYQTLRSSQQPVFTLYHREIDPFQVDYVNYFGQVYIDEVNRRVLLAVVQQGQVEASTVEEDLRDARINAAAARRALVAGNDIVAQQQEQELTRNLDEVSLALGASMGLLTGVQQTLGDSSTGEATEILEILSGINQNTEELNTGQENSQTDVSQQIEQLDQIDRDLARLEGRLQEFTSIDANVIVRPFRSEALSIAAVQPTPVGYYTPAVVALLLQHLAVTLAALSIVRERSVGTMELFRVSPLSAGEALIGKYFSYMIFGSVITALLTLLLVYGLGIPMLGTWQDYALVSLALLFTSLGIGFIISLVSQTDSQAVQYTMIVLLSSVFFSGFLIALNLLAEWVRVISWSLPTTYGIVLLRNIILRGERPTELLLIGLLLIGLVLGGIAWVLMNRLISSKR